MWILFLEMSKPIFLLSYYYRRVLLILEIIPVLSSAVLNLTYAGYYGDSTQQMQIEIASLNESIYLTLHIILIR